MSFHRKLLDEWCVIQELLGRPQGAHQGVVGMICAPPNLGAALVQTETLLSPSLCLCICSVNRGFGAEEEG